MKRVRFLLIIIVLAMIQLPAICKPKKLMYGDNIQYYGEVDKNKQPLGRGQLQLIGYAQYAIDITRGDFEGNKITNAEVFIGQSIWPNDPTVLNKRAATFTGTMEFDIKEVNGRTYLVYKLIDGILTIEKCYDSYNGYWTRAFSITCKPQDNCVFERYASPTDSRDLDLKYHGYFHKDNGDIVYTYRFYLDERYGGIKYKTDEKMSKAKEERLRVEEERKLATPGGLAEKIISMIDDNSQPFSEIASLADKLLAMEKTDERKQAVKRVIKECQLMGTGYNPDNDLYLSMSHEGTERGRQEMALAAKLQKEIIEDGDMQELIDYAYRCRKDGDITTAKKYFQKGADKGNAMAMRGLAFCYNDENNIEKAEEWYTKLLETDASEQFCVDAMEFYRKINRSDKILQILELCAEKSHNRDAMLRLGDIYRNGKDWEFKKSGIKVAKNLATAMKWYKMAREAGSKAALFFMADCYWTGGTGVTQNRVQAAKLYQQLMNEAEILHLNISQAEPDEKSKANYRMGYCLETGTGVVKNIPFAWDLYCKSNEAEAYYRRGVMLEKHWVYERLRPDLRIQQVRQLYQTAANMGHKQAQQALNRTYR